MKTKKCDNYDCIHVNKDGVCSKKLAELVTVRSGDTKIYFCYDYSVFKDIN